MSHGEYVLRMVTYNISILYDVESIKLANCDIVLEMDTTLCPTTTTTTTTTKRKATSFGFVLNFF